MPSIRTRHNFLSELSSMAIPWNVFPTRKRIMPVLLALVILYLLGRRQWAPFSQPSYSRPLPLDDGKFHWSSVPLRYPISPESMRRPRKAKSNMIPKIQHSFGKETAASREIRLERLKHVKNNFTHSWNGYKRHAWMS